MRTLYTRIIVITMLIMILSGIVAFCVTNGYYQFYLKPANDEKVTGIARDIVTIYEKNESQTVEQYLTDMTELGYQFYLADGSGNTQSFGKPFDATDIQFDTIKQVLNGGTYHGIAKYPWRPFITGFFDNKLQNTIGVPISANDGDQYALFLRQNTQQQFGEMRAFLAVMLVLMIVFSFLMVLISTRFLIKPIDKLTAATRKISAGNYHIKLNVIRRDEIGRLARDFQQMSNHLEQTEEKRQEFVSNVSHEIQSPLSSIQGFSQALREEDMTVEERKRYLSIIENESRRLSQLSRQLLTLSSLDDDAKAHEKTPIQLHEQLKDVIAASEWLWREKEMAVELGNVSEVIYGYPKLLHQVWTNLLANAIRYSESGGAVEISANSDKNTVTVTVEDNGIGINETDIPHLFERFYKVDKARTRTEKSTGLGLSIVKKIIELHGGTITVESKPLEGSQFHVTLPKAS
ncbi:two-component sensor histidine kinase [Lentibacillus kapialis]|uniref:Heme sensor protein HssS n=1 Tax=Lentibacillus kapialis TaxID=340214 RepID=A0A917PXV4_9BACI|nr:HAMP domain-containing sensor histidine kinase [Lentibacillus kapialis]GGJ99361.1 two-component sensor histidine kinase [Lentibacillus kapialis]